MPKLIVRCDLECGGVAYGPGDEITVDDDNAARLLRQGVVEAKRAAPKKKKKAEPAAEK